MSIYVETLIRGSMEDVWRMTQTPDLHERWDLRFTSITYLDRDETTGIQRFRYATRIGFGMEIAGWGETAGDRSTPGQRTSALKFGSNDPRALILAGSGFWKYEQTEEGVRFITGYDYEPRWGRAGRIVDGLMFRPMLGWATAWSFDRLRLWIERGLDPRRAARRGVLHLLITLAVIMLVLAMGSAGAAGGPIGPLRWPGQGSNDSRAAPASLVAVAGLAVAAVIVAKSHRRWSWALPTAVGWAWIGVAFSPLSSPLPGGTLSLLPGLSLIVLSIAGLRSLEDIPLARRCHRIPSRGIEERQAA